MDNLISETNTKLQGIIENLNTIKAEYENKLRRSSREIDVELDKVNKYKEDFFVAKQKIEKMNADIEGFEADYQNLVERFKDDELANILIAANKEISAKIDERRRKIAKDKISMNDLIEKAEESKKKLVKITAEKKALELCLAKILDANEFYSRAINQIVDYSEKNEGSLSKCFYEDSNVMRANFREAIKEVTANLGDVEEDFEESDETTSPKEEIDQIVEEVINEDVVDETAPSNELLDMDAEEEVVEDSLENEEDNEKEKEIKDSFNYEDAIDINELMNFDDSIEN